MAATDYARERAFFEERGFGQRMGFGAAAVLIVVDFAVAFTDPAMPLGAPLDAEIAATNELIDAAQAVDVPVVLARVAYDDPQFRDAGTWRLKQSGINTLRAGTPGVEIDPRVRRVAGDFVLTKKYASCFFGTELSGLLMAQGVDTTIIAGCTTSGCVRATALDAVQLGFRPMVVREAVGDRSAAAHAQALFDLDAKYADVVSLAETLAYLRAHPRRATAGAVR